MTASKGITIRFSAKLFEAIQKYADARGKKFGAVVAETCEQKLIKHEPTLADRVEVLEQKVCEIESKI
jgi:hypothetical protein